MNRKLTPFERLLVEIVHYLAYGDRLEMGLNLRETIRYLENPINSKQNKNCLECLEDEGLGFINELKIYMNELEDC